MTTLRSAAPPGWWVCDRLGIEIDASNLVPDVTVLRPRSSGAIWSDPADVALVVEVETPATRRYDRVLKPTLYAEAGIPGYWRVERGPASRCCTPTSSGRAATGSGTASRAPSRSSSTPPIRSGSPPAGLGLA